MHPPPPHSHEPLSFLFSYRLCPFRGAPHGRRLRTARRRGERTGLLERAHPPQGPEPPLSRRRRVYL